MSPRLESSRTILEVRCEGDVPRFEHPEWAQRFPWLVQGVTGRGEAASPFDMALFGRGSTGEVMGRWEALGEASGCSSWVHARQVHGSAVRVHDVARPGLYIARACDGHATTAVGVLLTVGLADCVGVSVVDPARHAALLVHAGWRGLAAGILERGLDVLTERMASRRDDLHMHFGPAICGVCYEVGPEVHSALGQGVPSRPSPVDLRAVLAMRAEASGVDPGRITASAHCTRCGDSPFFSHRAGSVERQVAFLGIRP